MVPALVPLLAGDANFPPPNDPSSGMGDGFAGLFVLGVIASIAVTVWKVSTARRMARDSGMDEGDATAMTLLTDDGFESTYLASNLRDQKQPTAPNAVRGTAAERLEELRTLHERGLIIDQELAEARRKVIDGV